MSNGIKKFTGEIAAATGEVAKDVKDELGKMIEQGAQTVAGTQLTPQQIQQRDLEAQKKLVETRRQIAFYQKTEEELKKVREQKKQNQLQKQQLEEDEKQNKRTEEEARKQVIVSPAKKTPQFPGQDIREDIALSRPELKAGHGKGG